MHQARKKLVKVLQSVLDEKRVKAKSNQHEGKKDLMDLLMEAEDEDGQKLEDEHIVNLILISFSAGFESSALAALWAIVYLSEHPEALKKAKVYIFVLN
jgi:ent-kaurenoic acid hydroxylase